MQKELLPWGPEKKVRWFAEQRVQRSYRDDVLSRVEALRRAGNPAFSVEGYGALTFDPEKFPLYAVRVGDGSAKKPTVLVTGGVHGYETSGVKGALLFLEKYAAEYAARFNFVVLPCISPWSYETVNRLDPIMENPNREFKTGGQAEESRLAMDYLNGLKVAFDAHIDLHETTDSDKVFVPAEYAKNGKHLEAKDVDIPDGFYLIGVKGFEHAALEKAMMDSVAKVTHIAEPDPNAKPESRGMILDTPLSQPGVIHINVPGLCAEFTAAKTKLGAYTTEMYPDSPRFAGKSVAEVELLCSQAQVACVRGALDFWAKA